MRARGTLYGVGVGPGDPELISLKAARILGAVPVIVFFAKRGSPGQARRVVNGHLNPHAELVRLDYPFTTEIPADGACYRTTLAVFYDQSAERISAWLDSGQDVAVLCEGDPFFYGSYAHLHDRLAGRHSCEVIPGVTAMSGCWTRAGVSMTCSEDGMVVLTGTMDEERMVERLSQCDAAVIMKVGRHLPKIRSAVTRAGLIDRAVYVERGTMPEERIVKLADKADDEAPYFSIVLVPSARRPL